MPQRLVSLVVVHRKLHFATFRYRRPWVWVLGLGYSRRTGVPRRTKSVRLKWDHAGGASVTQASAGVGVVESGRGGAHVPVYVLILILAHAARDNEHTNNERTPADGRRSLCLPNLPRLLLTRENRRKFGLRARQCASREAYRLGSACVRAPATPPEHVSVCDTPP